MVEPWTPPPPKAAIVKRPDNLYPERGKFEQRPKNGGHWAPGERHNALKSEEMCTFWNEKHEILKCTWSFTSPLVGQKKAWL